MRRTEGEQGANQDRTLSREGEGVSPSLFSPKIPSSPRAVVAPGVAHASDAPVTLGVRAASSERRWRPWTLGWTHSPFETVGSRKERRIGSSNLHPGPAGVRKGDSLWHATSTSMALRSAL